MTAVASGAAEVRWHERPDHCGWLTKKGEHTATWRKRWFVLKDRRLGQGLTLVPFSAQPEPFLTQNTP